MSYNYLGKNGLNQLITKMHDVLGGVGKEFTGTKEEVDAAIAAGKIEEGTIVNITDDYNPAGGGKVMKLAWKSPEPWLIGTRNADGSYVRIYVYYTRDYGFTIDPTKEYFVKYIVSNNLVDWIHTWITVVKTGGLPIWSNIKLPDGNKEYIMTGSSSGGYISGYNYASLGDHTGTPYNLYVKVEVYEVE